MKRLIEMVKELMDEYNALIEQEHDGMAVDSYSEPLTDLDYESEQP